MMNARLGYVGRYECRLSSHTIEEVSEKQTMLRSRLAGFLVIFTLRTCQPRRRLGALEFHGRMNL